MKKILNWTMVLVLALALSLPATAVSASPVRDREDRSFISLLIKKIQKIFGITGNGDGVIPPVPNPTP